MPPTTRIPSAFDHSRIDDPARGHMIAFVHSEQKAGADWIGFNRILMESLRQAAFGRGWTLLAVDAADKSAAEVVEQCRAARAWGVILDAPDPHIVKAAAQEGLSVVLVDDWHADGQVDTVLQDDFRGGFLAGRQLAAKGHRNIAWFGSRPDTVHHMFRLSGARAALRQAGIEPAADWSTIAATKDMVEAVRSRLSSRSRPTAALALWHDWASAVGEVARELDLSLEHDLELVGWCAQQQYDQDYPTHFAGGLIPATVVWNPQQMAEVALARLAARHEFPQLPFMLVQVEVHLRAACQR